MKTCGGKKRMYKKMGRQSTSKSYKQYCHTQFEAGFMCTGDGKWRLLSGSDVENQRSRAIGYRGNDT